MTLASDYLTLSQIDALLVVRPIAVPRMTFLGIQSMAGLAMILGNDSDGSTKAWICYDSEEEVVITR